MSAPLKSASKGRFQIYDPIGAGAVATVYRAYDRKRNEMCAIKVMNEESSSSKKRRSRFLSEAAALESLEHPNIVPVRAVGEDKGRLWIAMELMEGGSAGRALKKQGALSAEQALDIGYKVLLGLEQAHLAGIIHRDVKPQNILLGENSAVKLCDFGIARQEKVRDSEATAEALTQMFDRLGSIIYMAPEPRADPRDVGRGTDIYAMGATLFALLTSRRPPDLSRAPIRPKMLDPVPAPLRPLILKATHLDRTQRFATAWEMAEEVKRLRDHARIKPDWYKRPARQPRQGAKKDDFAQWPERHTGTPIPLVPEQVPETPATLDAVEPVKVRLPQIPSPLHRRQSYSPTATATATATAAVTDVPPPRPRALVHRLDADHDPSFLSSVPIWVWFGLAAVAGAVLFIGGLVGTLLVMKLLM
jgi:serine/threonine protein kinase